MLFGFLKNSLSHFRYHFHFRYRSPQHWIEVFRTYYGPTNKTFAALDANGQAALHQRLPFAPVQPEALARGTAVHAEGPSGVHGEAP